MVRVRVAVTAVAAALAPRVALACPVCFGQSDSPMASAANLSILVMLVITGCVLAGFASFFVYLMRRARMARDEQARCPASDPTEAGHHVLGRSQEGTAQC